MKLRGVDYGPISCGSGAMGFFGEGYWFHRLLKPFGLDWSDCTLVGKTFTHDAREGNMAMRADGITPRDLKPDCIWVSHRHGIALNAVGLSNPGLAALLSCGRWQAQERPFMLSMMAVGPDRETRFKEFQDCRALLEEALPSFRAPVALQVNFSCPNTAHAAADLEEHLVLLDVAAMLDIPLVPKIAVDYPTAAAVKLAAHPAVDALCVTNTLRFGTQGMGIKWSRYFTSAGMSDSPLAKYGGGGLSGRPLRNLSLRCIRTLRDAGVEKPIQGGGGILHPHDVDEFLLAGADSVFIASVAFLRPWRVRSIIREAHRVFWHESFPFNPGREAPMADRPESER